MKIVFYQLGNYAQRLEAVLSAYMETKGVKSYYYSLGEQDDKDLILEHEKTDSEYLLFYLISIPHVPKQICRFIRKRKVQVSMIALCRDYAEGIMAYENGCDYALLLPLETEKIIRCCEHLTK